MFLIDFYKALETLILGKKSISVYNHIIYGLIIHYIKYPNLTVFHKQVANKII